ncbi:hypothetical protein [Stenotrophomonas cyclobalanopsidis]|uniref:hypothetical protein n=1 Tax=Stenotrophomonas cyclobalanopsidis TaxID=2771362 RepID=UPI00345F3493
MTTRTLRVLAWCSVVFAACVAFVSLAPFTAAVIFTWPLLVFAAFCIWRGARLPGLLCAWLASLAFISSPHSTYDKWNMPIYVCWGIALVVIVALRLRNSRP